MEHVSLNVSLAAVLIMCLLERHWNNDTFVLKPIQIRINLVKASSIPYVLDFFVAESIMMILIFMVLKLPIRQALLELSQILLYFVSTVLIFNFHF